MRLSIYSKIILGVAMLLAINTSILFFLNNRASQNFPVDLSDIHWKRITLPAHKDKNGEQVPGFSMEVPSFVNVNEIGYLAGENNGAQYSIHFASADLSISEPGRLYPPDADLLKQGSYLEFVRHQTELFCEGAGNGSLFGMPDCFGRIKSFNPIEISGIQGVVVDGYQQGGRISRDVYVLNHLMYAWFFDKNIVFYLSASQLESNSERERIKYPNLFKDPRHLNIFRHAIDTLEISR